MQKEQKWDVKSKIDAKIDALKCQDDPTFRDKMKDACTSWSDRSCDQVRKRDMALGYRIADMFELWASCPKSCKMCVTKTDQVKNIVKDIRGCEDKPGFEDEKGHTCDFWNNKNCRLWAFRYSEAGFDELLRNCPQTCGQCDRKQKNDLNLPTEMGEAADGTDTPGFVDQNGKPCSAWKGYDCDRMWVGYTVRGQLAISKNCKASCK